ncbi:unnamed protein product [Spirodela intermedia]|uniref:Uncharacterized protein n=1 Tax=Spirodela intermedia TaxID=51605 RepID=A0A7I8J191_SPIIN|nr:unnamed protein product [Spirodela intermedia]CAA6663732.1 unnamed protein product [Spirodela intermedia]
MEERRMPPPLFVTGGQKKATAEEPEIINAWELMEDLDDEIPMCPPAKKMPAKTKPLDGAVTSPRKQRAAGKENLCKPERLDLDPSRVLKPSVPRAVDRGRPQVDQVYFPQFEDPILRQRFWGEEELQPQPAVRSGTRRLLREGPLRGRGADQEDDLGNSPEAEARRRRRSIPVGKIREEVPPGREESVVLYTTTLRGSEGPSRTATTDISMDSGFREELRLLMGKREVRVPLLFVKGRLLGGAEEVLKLEEEGKLEKMLAGIPRAAAWCDGCGGMRFVLCMDCCGSCKVFDEGEKKTVRCAECNENGLIRCPICG